MVILRKFCFCCQLTTGIIVLGCFIMILSLPLGIIHTLCLTHHRNIMDFREDAKYNLDFSTAFKFRHGSALFRHFCMAFLPHFVIFSAMKRKKQDLYEFLYVYMAYIVIIGITTFATYSGVIILLLSEVIVLAWGLYWWLCVLSLYQEIKEEEVRPSDTI